MSTEDADVKADRRRFLRDSGLLLSVVVAGKVLTLSPRAAQAAALPWRVLSAEQAATLDSLAEALVPGSRDAGISQFIDKQLAAPAAERLLMLKYLGVEADDMAAFYTAALDSLGLAARKRHGKAAAALPPEQVRALLQALSADAGDDWQGPPAGFFSFVLRSDASDVTYGTRAGFDRLGIPSNAHIAPGEPW